MTMAGHTKLYITKHYHNYIFVKTQRNSTQRKATLKQLALELDTVVTWNPPPHPTTPNFSATSRPARELKLGNNTH